MFIICSEFNIFLQHKCDYGPDTNLLAMVTFINCLGHCSMSKHGETEEPQALMQFSKSQHDTEEKCEIFFRPNYLIVRILTLL